jgi:erythronate-4-phosphate dehydrogenase
MRILADRNMLVVDSMFATMGSVELLDGRTITTQQLAGVDVLLVRSVTQVNAQLLGAYRPAFIGTATSGVDHIDRSFLQEQGVPFAWAPGSNADSVVDYVLSAVCHCEDKLERILDGAAVGVIGFGHIGRRLCARLQALGITVRAYDPWLAQDDFPQLCTLEEVLSCEVVSIHAELTRQQPWPSYHLLGADELSQLRPEALLISAGRGELIDTQALLAVGRAHSGLHLVLDVWEGEPDVNADLLQRCRFGSAHIAGYSTDGKVRATRMLFDACCAALQIDCEPASQELPLLSVSVPLEKSDAELIRWLVAQVYNIGDDDRLLRGAMPDGFDLLRKQYRPRRELGLLEIVNFEQLSAQAGELCLALGCSPGCIPDKGE